MAESSRKIKVLVVEDETIIAINICNSLQQFGYTSEYTNSGEQALDILEKNPADIILMDIMLGDGMDGIETSRHIQEKWKVPIIYLTAYSDQNTLARAQITEPSGYIIKPFHARELFITIELAIYKFASQNRLREMQNRLYESQRMESIGLLSSGIAHEINNPLTGIVNFALLGKEKADQKGEGEWAHYFETIQKESEKIAEIVKNLVNYSRDDRNHWVWANLEEIVEEILSFFRQLFIKENIRLEFSGQKGFPEIYCMPQKLKQAVLNLISFCRVSVLNQESHRDKWIRIHLDHGLEWNGKESVLMVISDSGMGISEHLEKDDSPDKNLYESNFSLPGLGFHFSQATAREHRGDILVEEGEGGTTLEMYLPCKPDPIPEAI